MHEQRPILPLLNWPSGVQEMRRVQWGGGGGRGGSLPQGCKTEMLNRKKILYLIVVSERPVMSSQHAGSSPSVILFSEQDI